MLMAIDDYDNKRCANTHEILSLSLMKLILGRVKEAEPKCVMIIDSK